MSRLDSRLPRQCHKHKPAKLSQNPNDQQFKQNAPAQRVRRKMLRNQARELDSLQELTQFWQE